MKKRFGVLLIITVAVLATCTACSCNMSATPSVVPDGETTTTAANVPAVAVAKEDAQQIALEHAGVTADQVSGLRTEYDVDDGVPQYEVEFRVGTTDYDYTIHAETGDVLAFDKDE